MPITMADVAARAGVSKTTVSRVLNGKGELDPATAARVRQVIQELGYVPSAGAVSLARGRTRVLGMLVPSFSWPWIGEVLQGVADAVEEEGYGLLLFSCSKGEESLQRFASQASAKTFDGLLVIEPEGTLDFIAGLHRSGLPVVLIDDRGHQPEFPSVATTNRGGAQDAARHLLQLGRKRPIVVAGPEELGCTQERLAGFAEVYAQAGLPLEPWRVVDGDFTFEGGRAEIGRLLRSARHLNAEPGFDAVFAHNDLSAAGAIQALREAGLRSPGEVAVVGFDDVPQASHTDPPLTTVHQPLREMGETAARALMGHFDGTPLAAEPIVLPTTLVVRGSTVTHAP
ncbi:MAG TPA: LacI family DNA-binding transcriptional regulator [Actinocrinis sp.]|uniref:LacI family DNA-binding transcriptional regulator n=1 Tax=Actinocrinis sp. TaxID=1920516 RepID=UPI002DDD883D|nr:LacI family DNA-binding transcriptional regulator [Actinocrinis sp.]HEV2345403.1 LacI family DNA-binding transcriptional regulator [Actinocrinis sp.]